MLYDIPHVDLVHTHLPEEFAGQIVQNKIDLLRATVDVRTHSDILSMANTIIMYVVTSVASPRKTTFHRLLNRNKEQGF